ncbi:MAG: 3-oxoacyl-ACP reductase FabG [Oscillospiraceae bacterium]|nr:3-oxoacyl-ACP reductase FabG [Oscillospiraceae bacterium]
MNNTVALITGASRGIGKAAAFALWREGCRVVLCCKSSVELQDALAADLNAQRPDSALSLQADITDSAQVERLFSRTEEVFGPPEILVNNAGVAQQKLFTDLTDEDWNRIFDVSVKGMFYCCRRAVPAMIRRKHGSIVNLSSMWGQVGASCEVHYSAAKGAVIAFTKALAQELGPSGIRVNCVAPGVIATEMNAALSPETMEALKEETPLGVIGTPEDAAESILFLASDRAAFITGQVLSPNGGMVL